MFLLDWTERQRKRESKLAEHAWESHIEQQIMSAVDCSAEPKICVYASSGGLGLDEQFPGIV